MAARDRRWPQADHQLVNVSDRCGDDGVVGPTTFLAIDYKTSVAQHLEVKRQSRLGRAEHGLQLADALLAAMQQFENLQTRLV